MVEDKLYMPVRWRMVCHKCGTKLDINTAANPHYICQCNKPDVHLHNLENPCELCREDKDEKTDQ